MDKQERKIKEGLKLLIGSLDGKISIEVAAQNFDKALRLRELRDDVYTLGERTGYLTREEVAKLKGQYPK